MSPPSQLAETEYVKPTDNTTDTPTSTELANDTNNGEARGHGAASDRIVMQIGSMEGKYLPVDSEERRSIRDMLDRHERSIRDMLDKHKRDIQHMLDRHDGRQSMLEPIERQKIIDSMSKLSFVKSLYCSREGPKIKLIVVHTSQDKIHVFDTAIDHAMAAEDNLPGTYIDTEICAESAFDPDNLPFGAKIIFERD